LVSSPEFSALRGGGGRGGPLRRRRHEKISVRACTRARLPLAGQVGEGEPLRTAAEGLAGAHALGAGGGVGGR